ncbi:hypothetical protein PU695_27480 [Klebsiella pneumoniae]|uniref:hypothetical protein n=1 Tax=Klebsiella pneumoniae TaxID=573 RepID=UPI0036D5C120
MDHEVTFSLSYELLTQKAEEEIRSINLNQDGIGYIEALAKASAILSFWYSLALHGAIRVQQWINVLIPTGSDWETLSTEKGA